MNKTINIILMCILCICCNIHSEPFETWPTGDTRNYSHIVISGVANILSYEALHLMFPDMSDKYKLIASNCLAISLGLYKEIGDKEIYGYFNKEDMYYNFLGVLGSSAILLVYRF